jgi:predicted enzyme related to lactoylglutathione lyase
MPFPKIVAVLVHTPEPKEALAWYERVFVEAQRAKVGEPPFEFLRVGEIQIEMVPTDEKVKAGAAGTIIYWAVNDFNEELARLQGIGATLYRGPLKIEDGMFMCQVQDPWGNCIGIRGPLKA